MNQQIEAYKIFIASPSELSDEREAFRKIVERSNRACAARTNVRFDVLAWEDKPPAFGRPQDIINRDVDQADLFVGCLWRTMGSPSGDGTKTGFEEEFYRALDRREKTGKPEIALFFKVRDRGLVDDPGGNLRKVLDFWGKHEKQLFFKEFESTADWERVVTDLLWDKSLQLAGSRIDAANVQSASSGQSQAEVTKGADEPPATAIQAASPAVTAITRLLSDTSTKLAESADFDMTKIADASGCVRLMLFSATTYDWNVQHIRLGTHEINSVYLNRRNLSITAHERLFLLRTVLLDPFMTSPGWYWVTKQLWGSWLVYLTAHDSDPVMRETAVRIAEGAKFPLHRGKKGAKPITRILQDDAPVVRAAGLHFLAVNGTLQDLNHITPLLTDPASEVRRQAERAGWIIRVRADADAEMRRTMERGVTFDDEMLRVFDNHTRLLSNETLMIASRGSIGPLRTRASKELLLRRAIPPEVAKNFCQDASKRLKEYGYIALAQAGESVDLTEVRAAIRPDLFGVDPEWEKADADHVAAAVLETVTVEELWTRVEAFDENSSIAIAELGRRSPTVGFRPAIRHDLEDHFERLAARDREARKNALSTSLWSPFDPTESTRDKMIGASLEALANQPTAEDRSIFLRFMSAELSQYRQTLACLRGLAAVGTRSDREKIAPLLSSTIPFIEAAAARAYIQTFPTIAIAAADLCLMPSLIKVWVIVATALNSSAKKVWPILKPLLRSENEDVRRVVCFYATRVLSSKQLASLLDEYLTQYHYYNVVVFLDRALYAPPRIRRYFYDEEREYLKKWVKIYHPKTGAGAIGESSRLTIEPPPDIFP
jgi:hypothetical protein